MMLIGAPLRGTDRYGAGHYGAPRGGRTHNGIDVACYRGSIIYAVSAGRVTKIGYPYNPTDTKKSHLRYVQITDADGSDCRYFYVKTPLQIGDDVLSGQPIGHSQGLTDIYPGITDHFHFEVKRKAGAYIDPLQYLEQAI